MKARYIAIIAVAAAMLSFSGCGSVEDEKTTGSVSKIEASSPAAADEGAGDDGAAAPASPTADNAAENNAPAAANDAPANTADIPSPDGTQPAPDNTAGGAAADPGTPPDNTTTLNSPGDHIFSTVNGDYTFNDLNAKGLANTVNGKWYCIVPTDAGAGHAYYQCYYSTDGNVWNEGGVYDETNGNNYHYAMPDGRILLFNTQGPIASNVPIVSVLALGDDNTIKSTPLPDFFKNQYLTDGSLLDQTEGLGFYITYNGGYNFTFSFTNEYGNIVYNVKTDLDPNTMLMVD